MFSAVDCVTTETNLHLLDAVALFATAGSRVELWGRGERKSLSRRLASG